ncbi:Diamine acetyltransferase [Methanosarcina sp. WWM596]|nr:Diamine acetyltransferase [Methanosarcina sp. WWM596]
MLDWNPAREFYEYFGAVPVDGWHIYRMGADKFEDVLEK